MKPGLFQKNKKWALAVLSLLLAFTIFILQKKGIPPEFAYAQTQDPSASSAAFFEASQVLLHPRCLNCHPEGDRPLVGDKSRPHPMNIERGPNGMGIAGLSCSGCHQDKNLSGEHSPPGAPDWRLPTRKCLWFSRTGRHAKFVKVSKIRLKMEGGPWMRLSNTFKRLLLFTGGGIPEKAEHPYQCLTMTSCKP